MKIVIDHTSDVESDESEFDPANYDSDINGEMDADTLIGEISDSEGESDVLPAGYKTLPQEKYHSPNLLVIDLLTNVIYEKKSEKVHGIKQHRWFLHPESVIQNPKFEDYSDALKINFAYNGINETNETLSSELPPSGYVLFRPVGVEDVEDENQEYYCRVNEGASYFEILHDEDGKTFYQNTKTGQTTWNLPDENTRLLMISHDPDDVQEFEFLKRQFLVTATLSEDLKIDPSTPAPSTSEIEPPTTFKKGDFVYFNEQWPEYSLAMFRGQQLGYWKVVFVYGLHEDDENEGEEAPQYYDLERETIDPESGNIVNEYKNLINENVISPMDSAAAELHQKEIDEAKLRKKAEDEKSVTAPTASLTAPAASLTAPTAPGPPVAAWAPAAPATPPTPATQPPITEQEIKNVLAETTKELDAKWNKIYNRQVVLEVALKLIHKDNIDEILNKIEAIFHTPPSTAVSTVTPSSLTVTPSTGTAAPVPATSYTNPFVITQQTTTAVAALLADPTFLALAHGTNP